MTKKFCRWCGKPFTPRRNAYREVCCSRPCREEEAYAKRELYHYKYRGLTYRIKCPICGKKMPYKVILGKYCSITCRNTAISKYRIEPTEKLSMEEKIRRYGSYAEWQKADTLKRTERFLKKEKDKQKDEI